MFTELAYELLKTPNSNKNPFFGKWEIVSNEQIQYKDYDKILDCINNKLYERVYSKTQYLISVTDIFKYKDVQFTVDEIHKELAPNSLFIKAHFSSHRSFLILLDKVTQCVPDIICAEAYKLLSKCPPAVRSVNDTDRQVHWVWFRKSSTYRLTEEILLRAASWIKFNPGYKFHLWTNLKDTNELTDFLADINPAICSHYLPHITVHYHDDFYTTIFDWLSTWTPELVEMYREVWYSTKYQDIVMKTDYTRNIILASYGGIYADFNDLLCLMPIESLLECHAGSYIGVTDLNTQEYASNYFMYASKDNIEWRNIVIKCTQTLPHIKSFMYDDLIFHQIKTLIQAMTSNSDYITELKKIRRYSNRATDFAILQTMMSALSDCLSLFDNYIRAYYKKKDISVLLPLFQQNKDVILSAIETSEFRDAWLKHYAYLYLHYIMFSTNLPIFCREQNIPLYLLPYSYLLRYGCLFSYIGHLGDGTSLGGSPSLNHSIRNLCI